MVVAEGELFRKREVIRNVLFAVLLLHCVCRPPQPRAMIVSRVAPGGWVLRRGEVCPVRARKTPEVVVKAVVFLNDDYDVCDGIVRLHGLFEDLCKTRLSDLDRQAVSPGRLSRYHNQILRSAARIAKDAFFSWFVNKGA